MWRMQQSKQQIEVQEQLGAKPMCNDNMYKCTDSEFFFFIESYRNKNH